MRINAMRATILLALVISLVATEALAQPLPVENHYKVYNLPSRIGIGRPITLRDQFGSFDVTTLLFDRFATPAEKVLPDGTDYPMINPVVHMDWWRVDSPQPQRSVIGTDQFGQSVWVLGNAVYLLTPSLKNPIPDPRGNYPPPPVWNHYLCYDAISGPLLSQPVTVIDQFGNVQVVLLAAKFFCNPVEKTDAGRLYPIIDNTAHLACYSFQPLAGFHAITTNDQFGFWQTQIDKADCLCVPALKDYPVRTQQSTWGKIKSLYRD
jgi:hypothetical protein